MGALNGIGYALRWDRVARGASAGFSFLIVGGLAQPLVTHFAPLLGIVWLVLVAVAASLAAGWRVGDDTYPALHGGLAALVAYILTIPVVLIATGDLPVAQAALTLTTTLLVGAATSKVAAHSRP
jgi:hypothetical protein